MRRLTFPFFALLAVVATLSVALILPLIQGQPPFRFGIDLAGGVIVAYRPDFTKLLDDYSDWSREEVLARCKEILADRLQRNLNTVPEVTVRSDGRIVVSIPSREDYRKVLEVVGKTYYLTIRLVLAAYDAPMEGKELYPYRGRYYELAEAQFSGDQLDEKFIKPNPGNPKTLDNDQRRPHVEFRFKKPADEAFAEFTGAHVGEKLAILLDKEIEHVATIATSITESGIMTGSYSVEEAKSIALMLRSGSLPISLQVESLSAVGPSLGQEIKEQGITTFLFSLLLLLLLLVLAYLHRSWFLIGGTLSLFVLLFLLACIVSSFDLILDMAGIAGLVLSIGIGMDAFILIFESLEPRMRGMSPSLLANYHDFIVQEIYSFGHEGRVLFHANATTLVVVAFLLYTDRLRSFALFIIAGVLASLLTIFITREILQRTYNLAPDFGPDLLGWLRRSKLGIFRRRRIYYALLALVFVILGLSQFRAPSSRPVLRFGADFKAGTQLVVSSAKEENIEAALARVSLQYPGMNVRRQQLGSGDQNRYLLTLDRSLSLQSGAVGSRETAADEEKKDSLLAFGKDPGLAAEATSAMAISAGTAYEGLEGLATKDLVELLAMEAVQLERADSIDANISQTRLLSSLSVLFLSLLFLAIYFLILQGPLSRLVSPKGRVEDTAGSRLLIATGVLIAVVADVGVILAIIALARIEISLPVVAALVTIVGYSVNDSVVLWSHIQIRHALLRQQEKFLPAEEVVAGSVDSILCRAVLTSLSTMVPAITIIAVGLKPLVSFAWVIIAGIVAGTLSSLFIVGSFSVLALRREMRRPATVMPAMPNAEALSTATARDLIQQSLGTVD